ncbi:5-hydroxytryptamine receptor 1B-like [Haliotis rubra]|uniref:5-hydroxytryptamine receptor 1B-like n=1 Tax=Haliotis rubra TaxID=36100 RepID=UPI001EE50129|nr:5-hydroxytryptamine receptor 1B-like [Haliotis rubra]
MTSNSTPSLLVPDDVWADYHNSSYERGFVHSAGFGIFICLWNFLVNSVIIFLLLCRRQTHNQYIYTQVVNLAVSDLAYSMLVDTVTIYYELEPWRLGQHVCKAWMILDAILPFVSLIIIIALNVDRLIFALLPKVYYTLFSKWSLRCLVILMPWVVSSIILSPLWLLSSVQEPHPEFCIYGITGEAFLASSLISLYIPAITIMVLTVLVLVTVIGGLPDELGEITSITFIGQRLDMRIIKRVHRSVVTSLCLINFCTLAMQLPYGAISMLQPNCVDTTCESTVKMMQALSWLRSACPGIRPLFWLLIPEVRQCSCNCSDDDQDVVTEQTDHIEMASANTGQEQLLNSSLCRNENGALEKG